MQLKRRKIKNVEMSVLLAQEPKIAQQLGPLIEQAQVDKFIDSIDEA